MGIEALFAPLQSISSLGPQREKLLAKLTGPRVIDLLLHLPHDIVVRRPLKHFSEANPGELVTLTAQIIEHHGSKRRGQRYLITCHDGQDYFDLVYFHGHQYLAKMLPPHQHKTISGKVERFLGRCEIVHPDFVGSPHQRRLWEGAQPIYALTTGITQKVILSLCQRALETLPSTPDWLSESLRTHKNWPIWHDAIQQAHQPKNNASTGLQTPFRQRLIFDELLANQLGLKLLRTNLQNVPGHAMKSPQNLVTSIRNLLPFELTSDQIKTLGQITQDMCCPQQMLRLVQGDVGSGKTVVALLAAAHVIENGFQAAFLAPTDILAHQHFETLTRLSQGHINITLLTGRIKGKAREKILQQLVSGKIQLLIGTHALIEDDVVFHQLGLAIIDEQHRFGVEQRLKLTEKAKNPHILSMTATPIPRTLQSILYGDLDVSIIREKPAGRPTPQTKVLHESRLDDVIQAVQRALEQGTKVFWVCPLVEESETLDLTAAQERFESLQHIFGAKVGLIHGKMKGAEKDAIMHEFAQGDIDILVATTVIEVGVDVKAANIMIIENAQRFGLSQLHQLRGRIGRHQDAKTPVCLLIWKHPLTETAKRRLEIMRQTCDGFEIAEEDLKLRGSGELLGKLQSGMPRFRLFDWEQDSESLYPLLKEADQLAQEICHADPFLKSPQGQACRLLLKIFEKDRALHYIKSA